MKDSLKIALGVFIGLLAAGLCALCFFVAASIGGLNLINQELEALSETSTTYLTSTDTPISGHINQCDDLGIHIISYKVTDQCPTALFDNNKPAEGAKFVLVTVGLINFYKDMIEIPIIDFFLNDYPTGLGSGGDCIYDDQAFGNACWQWEGKLYPDVTCEGWILFEVPEAFDSKSANLYASFHDYETGINCESQWPLVPPEE